MYDAKCYELAKSFLSDEPEGINTSNNLEELSQRIQDEIEDFISEKKGRQ